ncbi:hypothetical protein FACS189459_6050 [Bacilli bacterium]|nr:hypothetical protein FACS189459_6050 [Bacilli bacterium]
MFISNKYDMGKNTIMYGSILFAACLILIIGDIYIVVSAKLRNKKLAKLISKNGELLKEVYAVINTDTYLNMFSELYSGTSFDKYLDCN